MTITTSTILLPFQPDAMTPAQLAAVSYLARYSGHTHALYAYQLRRWFAWCEANGLDPLVGIQRAHVELYIRHLGESGLMDSSVNTMMHGVRGFFRFAHIDGLISADPAVYARLPKIHTRRVPHPGPGPARADPVPPGRPDPHRPPRRAGLPARHQRAARLRGRGGPDRGLRRDAARPPGAAPGRQGQQARHHASHRAGAARPGGMPRRADRGTTGPAAGVGQTDRPPRRLPDGARIAKVAGIPRHISPHSLRHAAITNALDAGVPLRDAQILARHADPRTTEHYDRARGNLDRHGVHFLTAYVAGV